MKSIEYNPICLLGLCWSVFLCTSPYAAALVSSENTQTFRIELDSAELISNTPVIIPALQARQNIWMPWKRWSTSDSSTWPIFDETQKEAALILPLGKRPDGEFSIPDIAKLKNGKVIIDSLHPFFNVLKILRRRNIRPAIDLGSIPTSLTLNPNATPGMFQTSREGPKDLEIYYQYIIALFQTLIRKNIYSIAEINQWDFQLYREPDNFEVFDPTHSAEIADPKNLLEYKKLYDYTLAGMRNSGVTARLSFGNLLIPYAGILGSKHSWMLPIIRFMTDTTINYCPNHLVLPRHKKSDTLRISLSAYGGIGTQLGTDPIRLFEIGNLIRAEAKKISPTTPIVLSAGEGGLFSGGLLHRGDGSAMGAAWNAAIFSYALASGFDRYQQWGWVSAKHASQFWESDGLPGAHYHVAKFWSALAGTTWLKTKQQYMESFPNNRIGIVAGKKSNTEAQILLYNYQPILNNSGSIRYKVVIHGDAINSKWNATLTQIDSTHGSYFKAWHEIVRKSSLSLSQPLDACMEYQFDHKLRYLWDTEKNNLRAHSQTHETPFNLSYNPKSKELIGNISLPFNSVVFLKITAPK